MAMATRIARTNPGGVPEHLSQINKNIKYFNGYQEPNPGGAGTGPEKISILQAAGRRCEEAQQPSMGLHARSVRADEVNRVRSTSVLAAVIVSAFVFGSMAGAAVPAEPGSGAVYERTVGTIGGGTIFLDADANGVQDSGERGGMSGVAVHLLGAAGERIATAETFAHACEGLYIFSGVLPGGNYTVEVVPPEGYGFTVPGMGGLPARR
ncbi:hypothetical protein [Methanoculleus chikugoensis]|uniref:SdrD B-like domain-containing protein n=1 Tax=Methanoculleus chikugoensis TaxID=118126 RepID=UPI001FB1F37A|nr:SdrD B-like domain-containing protein [Methanoculleus chikugoensis]